MNSTTRKARTNKAAFGCGGEPCAEMPAGTVFYCEDGVFTPVPEPQGPGPWALSRAPNVNNGLPYWASWASVVAGGGGGPGPLPPPPPVPPVGEPVAWDDPPPHQTVK